MGRKSRAKRERRLEQASRRSAVAPARLGAADWRLATAAARARDAVELCDPGPHALLPECLSARRAQLRDRLVADIAMMWESGAMIGEMLGCASGERRLDLEGEILHGLDARIAWEQLLAVQDADPAAAPDEALCRIIAECEHVERGPHVDPLTDGTSWPSMELADRLNATSSPTGSSAVLDAELAETEELVAHRCGDRVRSLLRYVAAEAMLHFQYPEGCWPEAAGLVRTIDDHDGAIAAWAAAEHVGRLEAVKLAVRLAPMLTEVAARRVEDRAVA